MCLRVKRFYDSVTVEPQGQEFRVCLDSRPIRSPAKQAFVVSSKALAEAVAQEWAAQGEVVEPATMPLCGFVNVAVDHIGPNRAETIDTLAGFLDADLLCYRAVEPDELRARQDAGWQPLLDWLDSETSIQLRVTDGVLPVEQAPQCRERLMAFLEKSDSFALVALFKMVTALGSLVLGLAVLRGRLSGEEAFRLSQLDEIWQEERWGRDSEDQVRREAIKSEIVAAERFLRLIRSA